MTNTEIIATACMLQGITEEVHTFARWKQMGYRVRKGEHAIMQATIWKASKKEVEVEGKTEEQLAMFMKKAHFFGRSQVEAVA